MYCNRCCKQQQPAAQCIATNCLHLFCIECAKQAFEADCICPVCQTSLTKSNIKLVRVLNDSSEELDLALVGQTPERVSRASQVAVNFYLQQAQLSFQLTERSYKAKITKVQQAAKKKLDEVHKVSEHISFLKLRSSICSIL